MSPEIHNCHISQVFFLVVVFGLFHGLVYFPILLSLIGPKGYSTPDVTTKKSDVENSRTEKSPSENSNGNLYIEAGTLPHSKSNEATQNGMSFERGILHADTRIYALPFCTFPANFCLSNLSILASCP